MRDARIDRRRVWTLPHLTRHGVQPADERAHPHLASDPTWTESVLFEWTSGEALGGALRVACLPVRGRTWSWVHLWNGPEHLLAEAPDLALDAARPDTDPFSCAGPSLAVRHEVIEPLRLVELAAHGAGRLVSGPRAGEVVSFSLALETRATGAPLPLGRRVVAGSPAERVVSNRLAQPVSARGRQRIGAVSAPFEGVGRREHRWGPEPCAASGSSLSVSRPDLWVFAISASSETDLDGLGYVTSSETRGVVAAHVTPVYDAGRFAEGRALVVDEASRRLAGRLVPLGRVEVDVRHLLCAAAASGGAPVLERTVVRFEPEDGSAPLYGFFEVSGRRVDAELEEHLKAALES